MSDRLRVDETTTLLPFLCARLQGWSHAKVKQRLRSGNVVVNGERVAQYDHVLRSGDEVEVRPIPKGARHGGTRLQIIYSGQHLVAIDKPAGLLSVGTGRERKQHALALLREQLVHSRHSDKLWPVHRLDRETSGVLLFATSREVLEGLLALWHRAEKTYLAVVEGRPSPPAGVIDQPLLQDPNTYDVRVSRHPEAQRAVTRYKTLRTHRGRTVLEVRLETGRQHQIRVHLAWLGHPVVGDSRYGRNGPRMGLHALRLSIVHPASNERLTFEAPTPLGFLNLSDSKPPGSGSRSRPKRPPRRR